MQLKELLTLGATKGVGRRIEKRAGIVAPLAVGAMIPGIVQRAMERAHSTEKQINAPTKIATTPPWLARASGAAHSAGGAAGGSMGEGALKGFGALGAAPLAGIAGGLSGGIGEMLKRKMMGREFGERKDPFHMGAGAAIQTFGKEMGTTGANLLRDIANKAMEAAGQAGDDSARRAIIGDLKRSDSVLANADDSVLMEAYHTMSRFAPVLSTDKNAVRSFLRQAVMAGSGPDFMSIKLLAESERAVTGGKDKK